MIQEFIQTFFRKKSNHIIIYSHGFGVKKDDRGLFTDIAKNIPKTTHYMFDYNTIDEKTQEVVVAPLTNQASTLNEHIRTLRAQFPSAVIDIIGHSQGCVSVAMAMPRDIRQIVFLAPPSHLPQKDRKLQLLARPGTEEGPDGSVRYRRRDGTTTIIRNDYWSSCENVNPTALYNQLSDISDVTLICALDDEVLGNVSFDQLSPNIRYIEMNADHNFTDASRTALMTMLSELLGPSPTATK